MRADTKKDVLNAYEVRLLLGQELGKYIEFAGNIFLDQDLGGDREREIGFSTATSYAIRGKKEHGLFCLDLTPFIPSRLLSGSIARKSHERFGS